MRFENAVPLAAFALAVATLAFGREASPWDACPEAQYPSGYGTETVCCYDTQRVEHGRCVGPTPFQPSWQICDDYYVVGCAFYNVFQALSVAVPDAGVDLDASHVTMVATPFLSWSLHYAMLRVYRGRSQQVEWSWPAAVSVYTAAGGSVRPIGSSYFAAAVDVPFVGGAATAPRVRVGLRQTLEVLPYVTVLAGAGIVYTYRDAAPGAYAELGVQLHRNVD